MEITAMGLAAAVVVCGGASVLLDAEVLWGDLGPGPRRREAREMEARYVSLRLANGIAACVPKDAPLPPSTRRVPEVLTASGYASTPEDWSAPAFACAGFQWSRLQHFSVRWQKDPGDPKDKRSQGRVVVEVDLDDDGKPDADATTQIAVSERSGYVYVAPVSGWELRP